MSRKTGEQMAGEMVVTAVGNLTKDPELRHTQSGVAVCNFTIAQTPRTFDSQSNQWKDGEAIFLQAVAWKELGEHVAASLQKGSRVIAQGRLKQRSFENKEGEKRTVLELEIDEIGPSLRFTTASVQRAGGGSAPQQNRAQEAWAQETPAAPSTGGAWDSNAWNDETPF